MTLRSYLWGMRTGTIASLAVLMLVVRQIDPGNAGIIGQLLFFLAAFLFLAGLLILLFTWLRRKVGGDDELALSYLGVSFRQGILMAFLAILLLIAQRYRILTWWDSMLTVAGMLLVELYFLTRR